MSTETSNAGTALDFGLDSTTQSIVDEGTAPATVTYAHYTSGSKLTVSDITATATQRVWVRRTVSAGATNDSADTGVIAVEYA